MEIRQQQKKITLRLTQPCPCGSGKSIANCHFAFDGRLRKSVPSIRPPAPKTGYSHPSCYLSGTQDCSEQISREHYFSRSVLEQLGRAVEISGAHWLGPGESLRTLIGNLTAKVLCKRHNEALSPLDAEAANFFAILLRALKDLNRNRSGRPVFHLAGGSALELWMLKVACGVYYGGIGSSQGKLVRDGHTFDARKMLAALLERRWEEGAGLYLKATTGETITLSDRIGFAPLVSDARVGGVVIQLVGLELQMIFDDNGIGSSPIRGFMKRLTELILRRGDREHHIILTWPPGTPESSVVMAEAN